MFLLSRCFSTSCKDVGCPVLRTQHHQVGKALVIISEVICNIFDCDRVAMSASDVISVQGGSF